MMPETTPLDTATVQSEQPLMRIGKDEMNLAEFPITLLTDRVPKGQNVIQYQDQVFDDKTSRTITRKLTISASEGYGLPTALDDDVILAMIQLTKIVNNFTSRKVEFSRLDLIRMLDWPDSGFSYKRLATSLKRWLGVTLVYENAWWDKRHQTWTTKGFHIIDNFEINDSRAGNGQNDLFPSNVLWNEAVFESFEAGYLKTIDYDLYLRLQHPTSKRLYRFLSKRLYHRSDWTFDLRDLAFEHIGLSRNYDGNAGKIKEKLQPAIDELEAVGFLEPLTRDSRYQKEGKNWKVRLAERSPALADTQQPIVSASDSPTPLVAELATRGVTATAAVEIVQRHPAASVEAKIEVFDWLLEKQDKRVAKNPAGFLVKSIEDDYAAPKGFIPKAERLRFEEDSRANERKTAEDRRRQRQQEARDQAERQAVNDYIKQLDPASRAEFEGKALAHAGPESRQAYENPDMARFRDTLMLGMLREYVARKLAAENVPVEA